MQIPGPWLQATLLKRYKRFLGDVRLSNGEEMTVHTPNTGAMLGCAEPGSRVWLRDTQSQTRKYRYSWELSETAAGGLVGVNPSLANALAKEAIEAEVIEPLVGYERLQAEVKYGEENSRIDWLLSHADRPDCYVEVKSVTLARETLALFPDAVSQRGSKHLRELAAMARSGCRAVMLYCIQRDDATHFAPAADIDSAYAAALSQAMDAGVEAYAYRCRVAVGEIEIVEQVPWDWSGNT